MENTDKIKTKFEELVKERLMRMSGTGVKRQIDFEEIKGQG